MTAISHTLSPAANQPPVASLTQVARSTASGVASGLVRLPRIVLDSPSLSASIWLFSDDIRSFAIDILSTHISTLNEHLNRYFKTAIISKELDKVSSERLRRRNNRIRVVIFTLDADWSSELPKLCGLSLPKFRI